MIQEIKTIEDVKAWFRELIVEEKLNFHPDTPFDDYINTDTRKDSYTKVEADFRDSLMSAAFEVCEAVGIDIYEIANNVSSLCQYATVLFKEFSAINKSII